MENNASFRIDFAPLQGHTDDIFRRSHQNYFGGITYYYTPFIRLEKGTFRRKDKRDFIAENNFEAVIPQIIAGNKEEFKILTEELINQGYKHIDLNMGCPFPQQVHKGKGAGILPLPEKVAEILTAVTDYPEISFSVKMRIGQVDASECLALLPILNATPLSHITLHPRLGIQQYKGEVNIEAFNAFYNGCTQQLLYNGDIHNTHEIDNLRNRFPRLAGVVIGRALLATPWLAEEYFAQTTYTPQIYIEKLRPFLHQLSEQYTMRLEGGEKQQVEKLQSIWEYLLPEGEKRLRKKILKANKLISYQAAVTDLLAALKNDKPREIEEDEINAE